VTHRKTTIGSAVPRRRSFMAQPVKHPDSGIYYLRRRVPEDLRPTFGEFFKRSLKTRDPGEAKRLHSLQWANSEAAFAVERPKLDAMMRGIARKDFDVVAAWSVDRLGRSLIDLVGLLQELHATGVDLYLHQQGINTATPAGKALFQMMGVFAEFEREMIRERVAAGLARAKAKGTKSGNPIGRPAVSADIEDRIRELRDEGHGMLKVAKMVGCGVSVVQRVDARATA
jgi:DNA invertase Pin-like site-specific DNA recombinase